MEKIKEKLGALFLSRKVEGKEGRYELHDPQRPTGLGEILFRGGIFRYLFRKFFLKKPILTSKMAF